MIMVVSGRFFILSSFHDNVGTISVVVTMLNESTPWTITCAYGPEGDHMKLAFLEELMSLKTLGRSECLLLRDFNLIAKASDKKNVNINNLIDPMRKSCAAHAQPRRRCRHGRAKR